MSGHTLSMTAPSSGKSFEERLQRRLDVSHFRLPPDFRREANQDMAYVGQHIPYVRFPKWHFCPAPGCGLMEKLSLFGEGQRRCRSEKHHDRPENRRPRLVPVRFVAICPAGHIEDFPFFEWVHGGKQVADRNSHKLNYQTGGSAALTGIMIRCSCGQSNNLGSAFQYEPETGGALHKIGYDCRGDQPWLGLTDGTSTTCGQFLRVVQRGGSNVYFPQTYSSIYLPLWAEKTDPKIVRALEEPRVWETLTSGLNEGKYISREKAAAVAGLRGLDIESLVTAAQRKLDGTTGSCLGSGGNSLAACSEHWDLGLIRPRGQG